MASNDDVADPGSPMVRKLRYLAPLTEAELALLQRACTNTIRIEADQDIVQEGSRPKECTLLLEGFACRYHLLPDGRRQILSFQFPGDFIDSHSLVLPEMDHSLAAITPCTVSTVPHAVMNEITAHHPRIARALWKETMIDASVFRQRITSLGRRNAYQRVAHLMCEVFVRLQAVGLARGMAVDWPMTQTEISDALGLSVVHVNRTLQALRRAGLITLIEAQLMILDWEGLAEAGGFDERYLHLRGN
ncbi:Crp/Fnr family transcriptional regulator [Muricoccus radiodurans]|uniref:Crp/Fnr family transcriptional regulator n=1 Tax=Muricoccus radiodurans TaxID=2231721 RepID=UPI003CEDF4C2